MKIGGRYFDPSCLKIFQKSLRASLAPSFLSLDIYVEMFVLQQICVK